MRCKLCYYQDFERICGESHEQKPKSDADGKTRHYLSLAAVAVAAFAIGTSMARRK